MRVWSALWHPERAELTLNLRLSDLAGGPEQETASALRLQVEQPKLSEAEIG